MQARPQSRLNAEATAVALLEYCMMQDWAGHDPYDALNSRWLESLPFLDSKCPRLVLTQMLKRSPLNLRSLMRIPKTQNPKGLGLFLSATLKLDRLGLLKDRACIEALAGRILALRSPGQEAWCWGYSFPWQTRTQIVPRWSPNAVCTIFVAGALLDLYEATREDRYLEIALGAADFVLGLMWNDDGGTVSLSYPLRTMRTPIHNANLLGAALLCRVARLSGQARFNESAFRLARYSVSRQQADGSWAYGESATQQWVDNFHTGFNLSALHALGRDAETSEFELHVRKGFEFYIRHFFREDGAARYFHDRTYPIDAHSVAQSIITLLDLGHLNGEGLGLARRIFDWSQAHLWDERGFFYYRILPWCRIKIPYMRWVQAWMLLAIVRLVEEEHLSAPPSSEVVQPTGQGVVLGRAVQRAVLSKSPLLVETR